MQNHPAAKQSRKWRADHPKETKAFARKNHLKRAFGITPEQYDKLFADQKGRCGLCDEPETTTRNGTVKRLAVDHNHVTGKIRKLLCMRCNTALGCFEKAGLIEAAKKYLASC